MWTPHAELYYHKSTKRGYKNIPVEQEQLTQALAALQQRWGTLLSHDPAYNPSLTLDEELFTLAFPPRRQKPWIEEGEGLSSHVVSFPSSLGGRVE